VGFCDKPNQRNGERTLGGECSVLPDCYTGSEERLKNVRTARIITGKVKTLRPNSRDKGGKRGGVRDRNEVGTPVVGPLKPRDESMVKP